jgi:hypothetical protein
VDPRAAVLAGRNGGIERIDGALAGRTAGQVRQRGSHRQFRHSMKAGLVTVAGKPGDDLAAGTLNSVLKQAGLR